MENADVNLLLAAVLHLVHGAHCIITPPDSGGGKAKRTHTEVAAQPSTETV